MFRGSNEINMDAKGRMAIPARYKDALAADCEGCLVVTIDVADKCLLVYPLPEWVKKEDEIRVLSTLNATSRRMQRLLIGHARDLEMDASGRILIPPELRTFAELEKKVTLVGQGHRLELWNTDNWNKQRDAWLDEEVSEMELPAELKTLSL
ncbi:MAG: cell division/cell wall cluster transcriptional repressor MraZ [Cellvibrionales bacterium]|nr:MAG: cell division/cell wall cluster transcriptional repressor MraZ [Cellvibrionales bacterium]